MVRLLWGALVLPCTESPPRVCRAHLRPLLARGWREGGPQARGRHVWAAPRLCKPALARTPAAEEKANSMRRCRRAESSHTSHPDLRYKFSHRTSNRALPTSPLARLRLVLPGPRHSRLAGLGADEARRPAQWLPRGGGLAPGARPDLVVLPASPGALARLHQVQVELEGHLGVRVDAHLLPARQAAPGRGGARACARQGRGAARCQDALLAAPAAGQQPAGEPRERRHASRGLRGSRRSAGGAKWAQVAPGWPALA